MPRLWRGMPHTTGVAVVHAGVGRLEGGLRRRWDHRVMHLRRRHNNSCRSASVLFANGTADVRNCMAGWVTGSRINSSMGPFSPAIIVPGAVSAEFGERPGLGGRLLAIPPFL